MHLRMMSTMFTIDKICQHSFSREYRLLATNRLTSRFRYKLDMAFISLLKTRYALAVQFKSALCIRWLAAAIVPELLGTSFATVYFLNCLVLGQPQLHASAKILFCVVNAEKTCTSSLRWLVCRFDQSLIIC